MQGVCFDFSVKGSHIWSGYKLELDLDKSEFRCFWLCSLHSRHTCISSTWELVRPDAFWSMSRSVWTRRALRGREASDELDLRNRLSPFCRISELQFAGGQCGLCCGRTSYLQVQWEVTWTRKRASLFPGQFQIHLKQPQLFMRKHKWLLALSRACGRDWKVCFVVFVGQHDLLKQAQNFCILSDLPEIQAVPGEATCPFPSAETPGSTCQRLLQPARMHKHREYLMTSCITGFPTNVQHVPCTSATLD